MISSNKIVKQFSKSCRIYSSHYTKCSLKSSFNTHHCHHHQQQKNGFIKDFRLGFSRTASFSNFPNKTFQKEQPKKEIEEPVVLKDFFNELSQRDVLYQETSDFRKSIAQMFEQTSEKNSECATGKVENKKFSLYAGFDPTADGLHVGNLLVLITLKRFHQMGFPVVALVGGATGLVGDPSGKKAERPMLSEDEVKHNVDNISKEINRFLGEEDILTVNNADWLSPLRILEWFRNVGKYFNMNTLLGLESVKTRLEGQEGMSYTEFSYVLLQSYDFYHLSKNKGIQIQIGGSDQWGNIVSGIDLIRKLNNVNSEEGVDSSNLNEKYYYGGMTIPLLTTADGQKFGKSAGNAVWLNKDKTSVFDFYQYFIRVQDNDVEKMLKTLTFVPLNEIGQIMKKHWEKPEDREAQKALAKELTIMIHGKEELDKVLKSSNLLFKKADDSDSDSWSNLSKDEILGLLKNAPTVSVERGVAFSKPIVFLLRDLKICKSGKEARRAITSGGFYINNQRESSPEFLLKEENLIDNQIIVVRIGKKNYHIIELV